MQKTGAEFAVARSWSNCSRLEPLAFAQPAFNLLAVLGQRVTETEIDKANGNVGFNCETSPLGILHDRRRCRQHVKQSDNEDERCILKSCDDVVHDPGQAYTKCLR